MKKLTYIGSLLVALLFVSVAAQAQDVVLASIGKSGQTQLEVKFDDKYMNFGTAGGSQEISFKTNTTVTATSSAAWCKATITDGKVNVTAEASNEENTREAELTISALDGLQQVITVRQLGTKPAFLINEETVNVAGINSRVLLDITSNSELSFALPDWITPVDAATAEGTKTYIFLAGELENNQTRSGDITVSLTADASQTATVSVTQTFEGFPKFFVISDTHFGSGDAVSRVTNVLNNLYSFESDIDAIIVNGDLTDGGQPAQYEQFRSVLEDESILPSYVARYYVMGNHEWFVGENAMENYSILGQDHNKYFDIKGYPFIYVGLSGGGEQDYSEESYEFLRESLADAAVRYAGRPIFVFTHIPVYGTTHGSGDTDGGWGNRRFYDIFKDYPQIIHFCGHTHFSLRDPKALWQGAFTSIDDGTSNYCYLNPGIDVDGSTSVEDLTNVNVRRIDSRRGEEIEPAWNFEAPYDGTNMPYASYTGGEAPYFPDTQVTTEEGQSDERTITFTQAVDDDVVLYYKVSVKNSAGEEVATGNRCSSFYLGSEMPETRSITLGGLPQGEQLYAEVIAYDPYGNASEPITSETFTVGSYTPAPGTVVPEPDLLDMTISEMGVVSDATGTFIFDHGSVEPLVYVDNTYQRVAAQFQGNTSQYYKLDYSKVIEEHIAHNADITLIYHEHESNNRSYMILETDKDERVRVIDVNACGTGVRKHYMHAFVARTSFLLNVIQTAISRGYASFSRDILLAGLSTYKIYGYKFDGYYSNICSLETYFKSNMDMLDKSIRKEIFGDRDIYTKINDAPAAKFTETAKVKNSLIHDGCLIEGTVENCILFRNVKVSKGAVLKNCIIMSETHIGEDCKLSYVVSDKDCIISNGRLLAGCELKPYFINKGTRI